MLLSENLNPESDINDLEDLLRSDLPEKYWSLSHKYEDNAYVGQEKSYPCLTISKYNDEYHPGAMSNWARVKYKIVRTETEFVVLFPNQRRMSHRVKLGDNDVKEVADYILSDIGILMQKS